jgi:hypothetical protein
MLFIYAPATLSWSFARVLWVGLIKGCPPSNYYLTQSESAKRGGGGGGACSGGGGGRGGGGGGLGGGQGKKGTCVLALLPQERPKYVCILCV